MLRLRESLRSSRLVLTHATLPVAAMLLCAMTAGCDKVESLVDDVKSQVSDIAEEETVTPAETPAAPVATPTPAPAQPAEPQGPTPEEVLASFTQLKPHQISNGALAQLASVPEAAAAVTEIDMAGSSDVDDNGLQYLAALPNLKSVKIAGPKLTAAGLTKLGQVKSLTDIQLGSTPADDSVVAAVATIPHLQKLDLTGTAVSPAVGALLQGLRELTDLSLANTQANDETVAALVGLPIRSLTLDNSRVTTAALPHLLKIETLEVLRLHNCGVQGIGFKGFNRSGIRELQLSGTQFGIDGFAIIKGMPKLQVLHAWGCGLAEHTKANVFKTFRDIRLINVGNNGLTDAGVHVFFKGHKSVEELMLHQNKGITDQGLAALIGVKTLKRLDVTGTSCTERGAQALKEKLPDCTIVTDRGTF